MVIIFAESWGSVRSLALRHGDLLASNRELLALGATNLASGAFQGMAVGAGFSASSANEAAGAQSKLAGLVAAGAVLMLAVFGTHLIELIPEPVLAAAVISALLHALNPKPLLALWRLDRDQYLALLAVLAVLFFGVLHGMLIAVALSIASAIRTFSQPVVKELGELGDTRNYVDRENHTDTVVHPGVLVLRPEEPLFFASVEGVLADIKARITNRTDVKNLVLSLEESPDIDSTAAECMVDLLTVLECHQINFVIARAKDPVRAVLLKIAPDKFNEKFFWSVADAVASVTTPT
ncbi:MAG: SulP family inorganic anion transporter [Rhizobacter sp.]|nr:SulP family inorganic anion transporter [Burkholderiales bacterium]